MIVSAMVDGTFLRRSGLFIQLRGRDKRRHQLAWKYAHKKLKINNPVIFTAHASFHGRTLATITATGEPKYHKGFSLLMPAFHYVPYNDIGPLESAIAELDKNEWQVVAILLEALQGEGRIFLGDVAYFQKARELCDEKGILLILNEVQVCMGHSGKWCGYENLGIKPNIFTSAKGLGGGIPIGAMFCKSSCDVFGPSNHASSFGGTPFVCAVALSVCQIIERENLLANLRERGEQLRTGLKGIIAKHPYKFVEVSGWDLINDLVLSEEWEVTSLDIVKAGIAEGLSTVRASPRVLRFVPPLIVIAEKVDEALTALLRTLYKEHFACSQFPIPNSPNDDY